MSQPSWEAGKFKPEEVDKVFQQHRSAAGQDIPTAIGSVKDAVVGNPETGLDKVEDFTTFLAEYAFKDGNIVVHFFQTQEIHGSDRAKRDRYWLQVFPMVLSDTAEAHFDATQPRIFAEYVPEMTSWYFQANGFATRLDPSGFLMKFLEKLDEALDGNAANPFRDAAPVGR